jgi:hypothetical protein
LGWQTKEQKRKNGSIRLKSRLKGTITNKMKVKKFGIKQNTYEILLTIYFWMKR